MKYLLCAHDDRVLERLTEWVRDHSVPHTIARRFRILSVEASELQIEEAIRAFGTDVEVTEDPPLEFHHPPDSPR